MFRLQDKVSPQARKRRESVGSPLQICKAVPGTVSFPGWRRTPPTPLSAAIERDQYDLAKLLLCNGYDPELEPRSILNLVLERKAWDFLELALDWGADPARADPDAVLGTYEVAIMERFWVMGNDLTRERNLAWYLATTTSNKPAYGWAKRHHGEPRVAKTLALALGEAVHEETERAVALLMWAGADSHRKVQSLRWGSNVDDDPEDDYTSAVELAVELGHGKLLKYLKPDPALDNFDELLGVVCDPDTVGHLAAQCSSIDWSRGIVRITRRMAFPILERAAGEKCLDLIFKKYGGRLNTLDHQGCQGLRRSLLKWRYDHDLERLLRLLATPNYCDPDIYIELTRTPAIKRRMAGMRL